MNEHIYALLAYLLVERSLSPVTVAAYRKDLLQFAGYICSEAERTEDGRLELASIDRERIGGYFLHLRDRGYSSASIARKTAAVRSFFRYLWRKGEIASDPTFGVGLPQVKKARPRPVRDEDVRALLAFCENRDTPEGIRDHAMLQLLSATGMRVSELVMVDVSDVDSAAGHVRVVGPGSRQRSLPLDRAALASITTYLERARPFLTRYAMHQTALVVNQRGQRLTRYGFWLIMRSLVRDAGLPATMTPRMLRLFFATHQIGEGLELEELRRLLGHASIATTLVFTQQSGHSSSKVAVRPVA